MAGIGAIGSYGSMSGYYSVYQNRNLRQSGGANSRGTEPVSPVARAQTTPVPPVERTPAVRRGAAQLVAGEQEETFRFPTMREGADPAEMAVRARIRYVDSEEENGLKAGEFKSPREVMEESECQTCKNRKYQDGSNDPGVSFKTPTRLSPERAAFAIRAHEAEHVAHARVKAQKEDQKIVSQSVSYRTGICPECGRVYMAGGTTRTTFRSAPVVEEAPVEKGRYVDLCV